MTANIWYNKATNMYVLHCNGKRYERSSKTAMLMLIGSILTDMCLSALYA